MDTDNPYPYADSSYGHPGWTGKVDDHSIHHALISRGWSVVSARNPTIYKHRDRGVTTSLSVAAARKKGDPSQWTHSTWGRRAGISDTVHGRDVGVDTLIRHLDGKGYVGEQTDKHPMRALVESIGGEGTFTTSTYDVLKGPLGLPKNSRSEVWTKVASGINMQEVHHRFTNRFMGTDHSDIQESRQKVEDMGCMTFDTDDGQWYKVVPEGRSHQSTCDVLEQ